MGSCKGKKVWHGTSNAFEEDASHTTVIQKGQSVKMGLDCQESTIKYFLDSKLIFEQELPPRESWYPAVGLGFSSFKVLAKLVPVSALELISASKELIFVEGYLRTQMIVTSYRFDATIA